MEKSTLSYPVRDNQVYLARKKHKVAKGMLTGWGGKMKPEDQDISITACREFIEESGVGTFSSRRTAIVDFYRGGEHVFECHVYLVTDWEGEIRATKEMGKPKAYPIASVPYDKMMKGDRLWLPQVLAGARIHAKIFYDSDNNEVLEFESRPL